MAALHKYGHIDDYPEGYVPPKEAEEACCHCGERLGDPMQEELGECSHGVCHAQCLLDNGCAIA